MAIRVGLWHPQPTESKGNSLIIQAQTANLSRRRSRVRTPSSPPFLFSVFPALSNLQREFYRARHNTAQPYCIPSLSVSTATSELPRNSPRTRGRYGTFWKCTDGRSPMTRSRAACRTSINNSKKSQRAKNEERLAGQSASVCSCWVRIAISALRLLFVYCKDREATVEDAREQWCFRPEVASPPLGGVSNFMRKPAPSDPIATPAPRRSPGGTPTSNNLSRSCRCEAPLPTSFTCTPRVQPRRAAYSRTGRISNGMVCWSLVDTHA
jgi:hypothetical protein